MHREHFAPPFFACRRKELKMNEKEIAVPNLLEESGVEKMILVICDKQVLLDRDLATLYGVETRAIN